MDMSDGPLATARELAEVNELEVVLDVDLLGYKQHLPREADPSLWATLTLCAGGDFELMFSVSPENRYAVEDLGAIVCGEVLPQRQGPKVSLTGMDRYAFVAPWESFSTSQELSHTLDRMLGDALLNLR
jgi:thiamine monophosphate kinase